MLSEDTVQSIYKYSPTACLILKPDAPDFTIVYANEPYLKATNAILNEIVGKGVFSAFAESPGEVAQDKREAIRNSLEQVLFLKKPHKQALQRYEIKIRDTNEFEVRFWSCDTYPLLDEDGQVKFIVRNLLDLTQLNSNAAQQMIHSTSPNTKNHQHPLFKDSPDAVFTLGLDGHFLSVNKNLVDLAECTEEELLQSSFIPFIATEDRELVFSKFKGALSGDIQNFDAHIITAKGNPLILNFTQLPIIVNKEVIAAYLIAKDITSIREAEQQLQRNHQQISAIFESITDGFYAVDSNWIVTYWNKEAEKILQTHKSGIMGKNLWDIFPEAVSMRLYKEYHKAMAEKVTAGFEEYYPFLDLWVEIRAYPSADGLSVYFKDISSRVKAEEQIMVAKEKYHNLFELSPLPTMVYDKQTLQYLDVNQACIDLYGYSHQEFLSMTLIDIRPQEDVDQLLKTIKTEIKPGIFHKCSCRHQKKSGEIIFVETNGNTINFDGKEARIVLAVDVTEKLAAQQSLKTSEQRFKAVIQNGSDLIVIIDPDGNYKYISPNSKTLLDVDAASVIGKKAFQFVHEIDKKRVKAQIALLTPGKSIKIPPFRYIMKNDKYKWMESIATDMTNDPAVGGIVCNSRDVTDRIENEIKIKESIKIFNAVAKATSDAVYVCDLINDTIKYNRGFKDSYGHKYGQIFKFEEWSKLVHPEDIDRVYNTLQTHIEQKKSKLMQEFRFLCADGSYKFVLDRSYVIYKEGQAVRLIGAMQNITERINYIRSMEAQNQRLSEISWMQCHSVRAPLASVLGLLNLLDDEEQDTSKKELIAHLTRAATELDNVVSHIIKKTEGIN